MFLFLRLSLTQVLDLTRQRDPLPDGRPDRLAPTDDLREDLGSASGSASGSDARTEEGGARRGGAERARRGRAERGRAQT